ncbi:MAG: EFR1 family ferrodoxin [Eubacterium sp.]
MKRITALTFSPTGTTRKAAEFIAERISGKLDIPAYDDDFTLPEGRTEERVYGSDEVLVLGVPVYAGRVPNKIAPEIGRLIRSSGNTPALAVVTFGNRSAGSALRELRNILQGNGFCVIAAGAFAAPHAFAEIGNEHPTQEDRKKAETLADAAAEVLLSEKKQTPVVIDGDKAVEPYYVPKGEDGKPVNFLKAKPKIDLQRCDHCGICADVCPMGSISKLNPEEVPGICIKCQACIKMCPKQAKYLDDPGFLSHKKMLEKNCRRPADSVIYLPENIK